MHGETPASSFQPQDILLRLERAGQDEQGPTEWPQWPAFCGERGPLARVPYRLSSGPITSEPEAVRAVAATEILLPSQA